MRVGIIVENSIEFVQCLLDIWNAGDSAVIIDWRIPLKQAVQMMKRAEVSNYYIDKRTYDKNKGQIEDELHYDIVEIKSSGAEYIPESLIQQFEPNYTETEAIVLYSSGTTGRAKGIILSHYAININADSVLDYMKPSQDETIYIIKSLAHCSTFVGELLVGLKKRMSIVIAPTVVSPNITLNNISKYGVNILCVNPALLNLYTITMQKKNYVLDSLRCIYTSGSLLEEGLLKRSQKEFGDIPILNVYGLTEAGPRLTASIEVSTAQSIVSVGIPVNCAEVIIVDKTGEKVKDLEKGLIHVKTLSHHSGYIDGDSKNKTYYKHWFNTGDIGFRDEKGRIYVTGRSDNMILQGSHNVYPEEIERAILKNTKVEECLVFGISDPLLGQKMICYYVASDEITTEIRAHCEAELAEYEIPNQFIKRDALPRTPNGKVSRGLAASIYPNGGN